MSFPESFGRPPPVLLRPAVSPARPAVQKEPAHASSWSLPSFWRVAKTLTLLAVALSGGALPVGAAQESGPGLDVDVGDPYKALLGSGEGRADAIFVCEDHYAPGDPNLLNALTLEAASAEGREVSFYREVSVDNQFEQLRGLESKCNPLPDDRWKEVCLQAVSDQVPGAHEDRLKAALSQGVKFKMIHFYDQRHLTLGRALSDRSPRVISVGMAHATGELLEGQKVRDRCSALTLPLVPDYRSLSAKAIRDMFDGFARIGHGQSSIWDENQAMVRRELESQNQPFRFFDTRRICHQTYGKTHAVAEVRIGSFNATVIAPKAFKADFQRARAAYPEHIFLVHGDEPIWHDEI